MQTCTIRQNLCTKNASSLFWRCLLEKGAVTRSTRVQLQLTHLQAEALLRRWFVKDEEATDGYLWEDNRIAVEWFENQLRVNSIHVLFIKKKQTVLFIKNVSGWLPKICFFGEHPLPGSQFDTRHSRRTSLCYTHQKEVQSSSNFDHDVYHLLPSSSPSEILRCHYFQGRYAKEKPVKNMSVLCNESFRTSVAWFLILCIQFSLCRKEFDETKAYEAIQHSMPVFWDT